LSARTENLSARTDVLATRADVLQIGVDTLRIDQAETQTTSNSANAELRDILAVLISRSDYVLKRVAIPLGPDILVRVPEGFLLVPAEDPALLTCLWEAAGHLEPGTIRVMMELLHAGDHVIDVGANVGLTVLPAARRVGPTGRVVALEPGTRVGGLLRRSLILNGLADRVTLHPYAAGDVHGTMRLNIGQVLSHSSLLDLQEADRTEDVEVWPLDDLVPPNQSIRLVKLDAEGFEPQVWRGMQRVIRDNPNLAVLIEFGPSHLHRAGLSVQEWLSEFQTPGFTAFEVNELTGSLRPLRPVAALAAVGSLNLLLLRQPPASFPELQFE